MALLGSHPHPIFIPLYENLFLFSLREGVGTVPYAACRKGPSSEKKTSRRKPVTGYGSVVLAVAWLLLGAVACSEGKQPVDYVNPFICTQSDHGQ
jgi:hypothetical protein